MNKDEKQSQEKALPFATRTGRQLMAEPFQHQQWLVDNILPFEGTAALAGKPKCGKSHWLNQLAVCIANGEPFLGYPISRVCDVLFLSLEGPLDAMTEHFHLLELTEACGDIHVMHSMEMPRGKAARASLEATLVAKPNIGLVIVDTIGKFVQIADFNEYGGVQEALQYLEALARRHHFLLLYTAHAKKRKVEDAGDGIMGSTAFRGATDTNIFLSKEQGGVRVMETEQRRGTSMPTTVIHWDPEHKRMSLGATTESIENQRNHNKVKSTVERIEQGILTALAEAGSLVQGELLTKISGMTANKIKVLNDLVSAGRLQTQSDGRALRYSIRELATEGVAA